jgi:hypothetical protein
MHVFQLIGSGLGTKKIAHALNLSVKTIETTVPLGAKLGFNFGRLVNARAKFVEEHFLPPQRAGSQWSGRRKSSRSGWLPD